MHKTMTSIRDSVFTALGRALLNGYDQSLQSADSVVTDLLEHDSDLEHANPVEVKDLVVEWQSQRHSPYLHLVAKYFPQETTGFCAKLLWTETAFPATGDIELIERQIIEAKRRRSEPSPLGA